MNENHEADGTRHCSPLALSSSWDDGMLVRLLRHRRSTKSYRPDRLSAESLARLLNAAFGCGPDGRRPYGSAHARYEIAVTVVAADVDGLRPGAYCYLPDKHALALREEGDHRPRLAQATLDAAWIAECPVILLLSASLDTANEVFEAQAMGRGERFCWLEAGLAAQNVYLWAAENGLGTVFLGGLDSSGTQVVTQRLIPSSHTVLGLLPIGVSAEATRSAQ